jgi:hypothetical protein
MTSPDPYAKANSAPGEPDPASVFAQTPSTWSRIRDTAATVPSGGTLGSRMGAGYRAGKMLANEQAPWPTTRSQVGPVGIDFGNERAATVDQQGLPVDHTASNAPELATQESLDQLHGKVDALASSASSGAAGGGSGSQGQQSAPQAQLRQPPNVLRQQAEAHQQALESMINARGSLADTRARFATNAANRAQAAASVGVKPAGSAIGMSSAFSDQSFFGTQGSSNGVSANNWQSARWAR